MKLACLASAYFSENLSEKLLKGKLRRSIWKSLGTPSEPDVDMKFISYAVEKWAQVLVLFYYILSRVFIRMECPCTEK